MANIFSRVAHWTVQQCGRATVFMTAVATIIAWVVTGPLFDYSDTWQLIINTGTTIITFLMGFLIQNTQNRDTAAIDRRHTRGTRRRESEVDRKSTPATSALRIVPFIIVGS